MPANQRAPWRNPHSDSTVLERKDASDDPPVTAELNGLVDQTKAALTEFKSTVDTELGELKKFGTALPETKSKFEKIDQTIADLEKKMEGAVKAERDRVTELEMEIQRKGANATGDAENTELAQKWFSALYETKLKTDDERVDTKQMSAYSDAYRTYLVKGDQGLDAEEFKALSVGSDPDAGYFVEAETLTEIQARIFETSPMRQLATVRPTARERVKIPLQPNDASSGGWVGEQSTRGETGTPQVGKQEISVHEQFAQPKASQNILDDAPFVEGWLVDFTGDKMGRVETTAFFTGNGVLKPRGFLDYGAASTTDADTARSWGILQHVITGGAGAFAGSSPADVFMTLQAELNPAYLGNANWVMNRRTRADVLKLKDGQGNYLWSMGDIQAGAPLRILGHNIVLAEDMPAIAADSFSIAFGDFRRGYWILDRQGIRVLRDPYTEKGQVKFYTTKRVGGDVVNFDAIKLMKFSA